jgi:hypothetical protein
MTTMVTVRVVSGSDRETTTTRDYVCESKRDALSFIALRGKVATIVKLHNRSTPQRTYVVTFAEKDSK